MGKINILPLTESNLELWFSLGSLPVDKEIATKHLKLAISKKEIPKELRFIVTDGNCIIGRFMLTVEQRGRVFIAMPVFADKITQSQYLEIAHKIIRKCIKVACEMRAKYLETTLISSAYQVAHWRRALETSGLFLAAEKTIFMMGSGAATSLNLRKGPHIEIVSGHDFLEKTLLNLFVSCQKSTFDRADSDRLVDAKWDFYEFTDLTSSTHNRAFWRIAIDSKTPVGLTVTELQKKSAWIAYIGLLPSYRRRGIGSKLLESTIKGIVLEHNLPIKSLVDIQNIPSIHLHRSLGFCSLPDFQFVYRMAL